MKFKNLLSIPDKISHIALLGNSTGSSEFLEFLAQVSPNISIVCGEFDSPKIKIPKPGSANTRGDDINSNNDKNIKNSKYNRIDNLSYSADKFYSLNYDKSYNAGSYLIINKINK